MLFFHRDDDFSVWSKWCELTTSSKSATLKVKSQKILALSVISFPARCMCSSCLFKGRGVFKDPLTTKGKMSLFLFHSGTGRRVWKLYRASKTSDKSHLLQQVFSRASLGYKLLSFSMLFNNLALLLTGEAGYWRFLSSEAKLKCRGKWADPVQWIKC